MFMDILLFGDANSCLQSFIDYGKRKPPNKQLFINLIKCGNQMSLNHGKVDRVDKIIRFSIHKIYYLCTGKQQHKYK